MGVKALTKSAIALLTLATLLLVGQKALAGVRCETQYGGEEKCAATEITLNKKVRVPSQGKRVMSIKDEWIDNFLITHTYKFAPNQEVEFQLSIENTSKLNFGQLEVRDFLPQELELLSNETKFNLKDFNAGDKREFYLKAKTVSLDKLPADKDIVCSANRAEVWTDGGTFQDQDTAQICISKKPLVLPKTGPSDLILVILTSLLTFLTGIFLVRYSRNFGR